MYLFHWPYCGNLKPSLTSADFRVDHILGKADIFWDTRFQINRSKTS